MTRVHPCFIGSRIEDLGSHPFVQGREPLRITPRVQTPLGARACSLSTDWDACALPDRPRAPRALYPEFVGATNSGTDQACLSSWSRSCRATVNRIRLPRIDFGTNNCLRSRLRYSRVRARINDGADILGAPGAARALLRTRRTKKAAPQTLARRTRECSQILLDGG